MFNKKVVPLVGITLAGSLLLAGCSTPTITDNGGSSQSSTPSKPITPSSGEASLLSLADIAANSEKEMKAKGFKEIASIDGGYEQTIMFSPDVDKTLVIGGNEANGYSVQPFENAMIISMLSNIMQSKLETGYKIENDAQGKWILSDENAPSSSAEIIVKNNLVVEYTLIDNGQKVVTSKISYNVNDADKALIKKTIAADTTGGSEGYEQPDADPQPVE